jgi:hypothetical protein
MSPATATPDSVTFGQEAFDCLHTTLFQIEQSCGRFYRTLLYGSVSGVLLQALQRKPTLHRQFAGAGPLGRDGSHGAELKWQRRLQT